jgi:CheY-like chemotaxis protein
MGYLLIVDDDPNIRLLVTDLMENFGLETKAVSNGKEALEAVEAEAPDAIILDMMMPVMDGFTTITHLQGNKATRQIPIILMSAIADHRGVARLPGVKAVLRKGDFSIAQFRTVMEQVGLLDKKTDDDKAA